MEIMDVDFNYISANNIVEKKHNKSFHIANGLCYKLLTNTDLLTCEEIKSLCVIEDKINRLEALGINEITGICAPLNKLYYNNQFIGYTMPYLEGFTDITTATQNLSNNTKIDLLIEVSQTLKELHIRQIAHTDIHYANILTNGVITKIIDFDDSYIFKEGEVTPYYKTPVGDIGRIKELIFQLLIEANMLAMTGVARVRLLELIKEYMYDVYCDGDYVRRFKAVIPHRYPHDWLDKFRPCLCNEECYKKK